MVAASTAAGDAELSELAASLAIAEVPIKLRCAVCSLIAFNAQRLPCCSQNICESCFNDLEGMCQVCHHEPLDKSLCEPNKSLRMTVKAVLKKKLVERAAQRKKEEAAAAAAVSTPAASAHIEDAPVAKDSGKLPADDGNADVVVTAQPENDQGQLEVQNGSGDTVAVNANTESIEANNAEDDVRLNLDAPNSAPANIATDPQTESAEIAEQQETSGQAGPNSDLNSGGAANSNISNAAMGMNAMNGMMPMGFTQMMAGGMANPLANFASMMGMGMDPMMMAQMSQMFGNFGGPNAGMNGMNGMQMGNFDAGQGQFGAMQNNDGGSWMGQGGGYNNVPAAPRTFNQMNTQTHAYGAHDYASGYGGRGRGGYFPRGAGRGARRGFYNQRGNFGPGSGYGYPNSGRGGMHNASFNPSPTPAAGNSHGATSTPAMTDEAAEAQLSKELDPGGLDDFAAEADTTDGLEKPSEAAAEGEGPTSAYPTTDANSAAVEPSQQPSAAKADGPDEFKPVPIQTFMSEDMPSRATPSFTHGPGNSAMYTNQHGFNSRANEVGSGAPPSEPRGMGVVGAPTGPRAMRQGPRNTGRGGLGRPNTQRPQQQQAMNEPQSVTTPVSANPSASEVKEPEESGRPLSRQRTPTRFDAGQRSPSPSYSLDEQRRRRSFTPRDERQQEHRDYNRQSEEPTQWQRSRETSQERPSNRHRDSSDGFDRRDSSFGDYDRDQDHRGAYQSKTTSDHRRRSRSPVIRSSGITPTSAHAPSHWGDREDHSRKRRQHEHDPHDMPNDRDTHKRSRRQYSPDPSGGRRYHHSREMSRSPSPDAFRDSRGTRQDFYTEDDVADRKQGNRERQSARAGASRSQRRRRNRERQHDDDYSAEAERRGHQVVDSSRHQRSGKGRSREREFGRKLGRDRPADRDRDHAPNARPPSRQQRPPTSSQGGGLAARIKPEKDSQTEEREARNRERLMREMQRRAIQEAPTSRQGGGGSGRRSSHRYDDEEPARSRRSGRDRY